MSAEMVTAGTPLPAPDTPAEQSAAPAGAAPTESWRDTHQMLSAGNEEGTRRFRARNLATEQEEWLSFSDVSGSDRREAVWQCLQTIQSPHLQRAVARHVAEERVEVWADVGTLTLAGWRAGRAAPEATEVVAVVRDLADALAQLHRVGVGHFALRPEHVAVVERPGELPQFCLTGLEWAERFEQPGLVNIAVDPCYAPPEAAGLFQHSPGSLLTAWDFWSLGRVVQEFMLGHGVLELLPANVRSRLPLSLAGQAESLLTERETGTLRAGAVELMPGLGRRELRLLRGLLTGAREGRWGAGELAEWLAGGDPVEHYEAPRHRRFFRVDGRGYTVSQAAGLLVGPVHHATAVPHVFAPDQPGTLAAFVAEARGHQAEQEQMQACRQLVDLPALGPFALEQRRDAVAAVCLQVLSRGAFHWRGQLLDEAALQARLTSEADFPRVSGELRLLSLPLLLELMRKHDAQTADFLERLRGLVEGAEQFTIRNGWAGDRPEQVWLAALGTPAELREKVAALHRQFALTTNKALAPIFSVPHPTPAMQVVLAWAGGAPERYGFRTHEQVRQQELAGLERSGQALVRALFWHRLARALGAVPLIFSGHWVAASAGVAVFAALAVHVPGPAGAALGFAPLVILLGLRVVLNRWQGRLVRLWTGATWGWRDGPARCRAELRSLGEQTGVPGLENAVRSSLQSAEARRAELMQPGEGRAKFSRPPRQLATWGGALAVWALLLGIFAGSGWRLTVKPPDWAAHRASWTEFVGRDRASKEPPDPRMSWPFREPLKPDLKLATAAVFEASQEQEEYALARGRRLVANYRPDTIKHLVAIYVSVDDRQGGRLMYDGRKGAIVGKKGPVLNFVPMPRSWVELENQMVVFIDK